jgi:hypothetical protein
VRVWCCLPSQSTYVTVVDFSEKRHTIAVLAKKKLLLQKFTCTGCIGILEPIRAQQRERRCIGKQLITLRLCPCLVLFKLTENPPELPVHTFRSSPCYKCSKGMYSLHYLFPASAYCTFHSFPCNKYSKGMYSLHRLFPSIGSLRQKSPGEAAPARRPTDGGQGASGMALRLRQSGALRRDICH